MGHRIGVDIGGTFTDFVLYDEDSGVCALHKRLTTPDDPARAVIEGVHALAAQRGIDIADLDAIVHGTTLVTNGLIERRGARAGMLVTAGFRDVADIGTERRYDLFDLRLRFPAPLVPRRLRVEVDERIRHDGSVAKPLDEAGVRRAVEHLVKKGRIEALAIGFLNSYANPAHEARARQIALEVDPGLHVCTSAEVSPFMREYERWTTTMANAYAQPLVDRYLSRLEAGLSALGFRGEFFVMTSSGGTVGTGTARRFPVRLLESGPAGGVLMSAEYGRMLKLPDLLSFDMGGTTAKGSVVRAHEPLRCYELEVAREHDFKKGSGLPMRIPALELIEIGAGGGSIAEVDGRGLLRVGPRSASADPGPVCYGRGGELPTLTDANLLLGYLNADFFLGGAMRLDRSRAEVAMRRRVAEPLGLELVRAAWGVHEIVNEDVARAFRVHGSERGFDYRGCSMVAFGGSGPLHAMRIARKLRIPRVVFPAGAGVMSAFGLLASPLSFEAVRSGRVFIDELAPAELETRFRALEAEAASHLKGPPQRLSRRLDMRYFGQGHEVEVELPPDLSPREAVAALPALFVEAYGRAYAMSLLDSKVEIVNWKLQASGPIPEMGRRFTLDVPPGRSASKGRRMAWFDGEPMDCEVYDRYALAPGAELSGPALIEERESTCVIGPGDRVTVDARHNLIATAAAAAGGTPGRT